MLQRALRHERARALDANGSPCISGRPQRGMLRGPGVRRVLLRRRRARREPVGPVPVPAPAGHADAEWDDAKLLSMCGEHSRRIRWGVGSALDEREHEGAGGGRMTCGSGFAVVGLTGGAMGRSVRSSWGGPVPSIDCDEAQR